MTISSPLKQEISTAEVFLGFGPILMIGPKYRLTVKFLLIFFTQDCPMKIKISQAQNNWFVFKETPVYKRVVRRSARPRCE